jgi:putative tricarboxylic transport membrane protein
MLSMHLRARSAGAITSVLFNIPGEHGRWRPPSTAIHGAAGRAGEALTAAFTSSFVGALFAVIMITLVAPLVARSPCSSGRRRSSGLFLAFWPSADKEPPFRRWLR